jgi:hypothetical protein
MVSLSSCSRFTDRDSLSVVRLQLPVLAEKSRHGNFARPARSGRRGQVDDGIIRQIGDLQGIIRLGIFAEGDAAVDYNVPFGFSGFG